ncbi:exodeoxyribonuclease III [Hydrogenimonas sp.]|uniref:exodeoxyribonuclease III n=1 Tax=Hydrogenimonas sp. TaxID=2231112 RepID=UPI002601C568|nr:exodeoxyribonuclease III [Hydrogenimonas sp.]
MAVSICSFNVNSIRSRIDLILRWLTEKRDVDILCFQETKCEADQFPGDKLSDLGYHIAINGQKRLNGVAICSKLPIEMVKTEFGNDILDREKRLIEAKVGNTVILNCYIPRGGPEGEERHTYKMAFFDALTEYTRSLLEQYEKIVLLGDFNVALRDADVYDVEVFEGAIGFLSSEKERLNNLLAAGLSDCYRRLHPDEKAFTWWDYRSAGIWRDEGMRIDYILANPTLCSELESIDVDLWTRRRRSPTPSDHAPVVATFREF